jgi:gas vesicle protein
MEILVGAIIGAVIAWIAPNLSSSVLRPAAKSVIKGGVVAYKATAEAVSEARESVGDVVAEATSEMARKKTGKTQS